MVITGVLAGGLAVAAGATLVKGPVMADAQVREEYV
jgi:hypothetical protein